MGAGFGFTGQKHEAAWQWLNDQDVDVALLQEAVPFEGVSKLWGSALFQGKYQNWGSAVLVRDGGYSKWEPSESHHWLQRVGGAVVLAQPDDPDGLWFGSVHSDSSSLQAINAKYPNTYADLPDDHGVLRCNKTELWEVEVIAHEVAPLLNGRDFVFGGDLNSSLLFDKRAGGQESRLFENLKSLGFSDTRTRHSVDEVQTFFKKGRRAFQLDHVYADVTTESRVTSWSVLSEVAAEQQLSDHAPLLIELAPNA